MGGGGGDRGACDRTKKRFVKTSYINEKTAKADLFPVFPRLQPVVKVLETLP